MFFCFWVGRILAAWFYSILCSRADMGFDKMPVFDAPGMTTCCVGCYHLTVSKSTVAPGVIFCKLYLLQESLYWRKPAAIKGSIFMIRRLIHTFVYMELISKQVST